MSPTAAAGWRLSSAGKFHEDNKEADKLGEVGDVEPWVQKLQEVASAVRTTQAPARATFLEAPRPPLNLTSRRLSHPSCIPPHRTTATRQRHIGILMEDKQQTNRDRKFVHHSSVLTVSMCPYHETLFVCGLSVI